MYRWDATVPCRYGMLVKAHVYIAAPVLLMFRASLWEYYQSHVSLNKKKNSKSEILGRSSLDI